jgi:hypothetical protein
MMKHTILALLCIGMCSVAAAEKLKLTTVFDKTAFYRGEPVIVWLVAENGSADTIVISAAAPIGQSFEVVDEHGKPLRYIGAVVQRMSGAVDETQIISPGSRRVYAEILDYSYPMHLAGTYRVTARVQAARTLRPVTGRWKPSDGSADLRTVRSEPQTITVTDINDPAVAILKDCKGGWLSCINDVFVRHSGEPSRPWVQLTAPSILDPYIALVRMRFLERPRDLRRWRQAFVKRFPDFDQPGLLWMNIAQSTDRYKLKELDILLQDARNDPVMTHHPALLVMERQKSMLLDESKEATP